MTFRRGFTAAAYATVLDFKAADRDGKEVTDTQLPELPFLSEVTLVDVDDQPVKRKGWARIRYPVKGVPDRFLVGEMLTSDLVDLKAVYAAKRIDEIEMVDQSSSLSKILLDWIQQKQRISWSANPLGGAPTKEWLTPVAVGPTSFTMVASSGETFEIPFDKVNLPDVSFERSKEEITEREQKLETGKALPLVSIDEALKMVRSDGLLARHLAKPQAATISVAETNLAFETACGLYLLQSPRFRNRMDMAAREALTVNAFADTRVTPRQILLRPGAQGAGTEVHEYLHTQNGPQFDRMVNTFLSEGITEYLARKATGRTFDRTAFYNTEFSFVEELVAIKATTDAALAALYFNDDWAGFADGIRNYAGDLVSIETVLAKAEAERPYAALKYLRELSQHPSAPLDDYRKTIKT